MSTYYTETFPSASPAFGGDQAWTEITGDWVNAGSNTATVTLGSAVAYARCDNTSVPSADMAVTVTVNAAPSGRSAGVAARMSNSGTLLASQSFYAADVHFDTGTMYVLKCVSGTVSVLTSVAFTAPSFPCTITLSVYGTALEVDLNGSAIWSGTDSSISGGNRAGLDTYNSSGDVVFSAFTVATAVQALVSVPSTDSGSASETAAVTLLNADSASAAETASITITITSSDAAQLADGNGGYGSGLYGEGGYGAGGTGTPTSIGVIPASADTATAAELAAVTTALASADAGSVADVGTVAASVASTDSAVAASSPESLAASVADTDTASLADSAAPAVGLASVSDGATFDEASPTITLTGPTDGAAGLDTGQVAASLASVDGASAADTGSIPVVGPTSTDTAAANDTAAVTATLGDSDSGTAADLVAVTATATDADGATLSEAAATAVVKADSDTAIATDGLVSLTATVADVDLVAATGSGDGYGSGGYGGGGYGGSVPTISLSRADSATAVDAATLTPSVTSSDAASLSEATPTVAVASADAGAVAESSALTYLLTGADSITAADSTVLAPSVSGSDGVVAAELVVSLTATVAGTDGATAGETASVAATLAASDAAGGTETALIQLSDTDSMSLAEATSGITVYASDLHVAIDSLGSLTAIVSDVDTVAVAMSGDNDLPAAIRVAAATPDGVGLAEAVTSMSATVTAAELASVVEQMPAVGLTGADTANAADTAGLAVAAQGADGASAVEAVASMSAAVAGSELGRAEDLAHIDATVNGGTDAATFDDTDALARVITAILTGLDEAAEPSDATGYGDPGYGGGQYGGSPGGVVIAGTPSPAVIVSGGDEPALVLSGTPTI